MILLSYRLCVYIIFFYLLKGLSNKHGWTCKWITYYTNNTDSFREEIARDFEITKDEAKQLILIVMYGGVIRIHKNKRLIKFQQEMQNIMDSIINKYIDVKKLSNKKSADLDEFHKNLSTIVTKQSSIISCYDRLKASVLALVLQTEEFKCIMVLDKSMTNNGRSMDVLIHDGGLVKKEYPTEMTLPDSLLRTCELDILRETGHTVKLVCKEMKSSFLFDNNIPTVDYINDSLAAKRFYDLNEGRIFKEHDKIWIYRDDAGVWSNDNNYINRFVDKDMKNMIFYVCTDDNKTSIQDYGGRVYNIQNMLSRIANHCPIDNNFVENNIEKGIEKLIFTDGIYDFNTDTFTEGFNINVFSIYHIDKPFIHERNEKIINHVHKLLFEDPFIEEDISVVHELKKHIAASVAGSYRSKKFRIVVGSLGDSGKGTLCDCLSATFGEYVDGFTGSNLFDKSNINVDPEKKLGWLQDIAYKRMAFSNEMNMSGHMDGNLVKSVSSGGDPFKGRKNFENPEGFRSRCQLWMFLNDIPKIKPYDIPLNQRTTCFEYKISFLPHPDSNNIYQKKQDLNIKNLFLNIEYQYAFFDILRAAYQDYLKEGFIEIDQLKRTKEEWLQSENALLFLLNKAFEITNNDNDFVPFTEIQKFIKSNDMQLSDTKLGRELTNLGFKKKKNEFDKYGRSGLKERSNIN